MPWYHNWVRIQRTADESANSSDYSAHLIEITEAIRDIPPFCGPFQKQCVFAVNRIKLI